VDCTVPWFSLADVWQIRDEGRMYLHETSEKISELGLANSAARLLPAGTVVLSRTASVGFAGILGCPMATTQDFVNWVCGPAMRPEYLLYAFRAMRDEFRRLMFGSTHKTIYMPDVRALRVPVPPLDEQDRIVAYLNLATSHLNGLLAEQAQLVDQLRERRVALIEAAVTGRLTAAALRPAEVPALGEVGRDWRLTKVKHLAVKIGSGKTPRGGSEVYRSSGVLFLRSQNVHDPGLRLDDAVFIPEDVDAEMVATRVQPEDVLLNITGASIGRCCKYPEGAPPANVNQHVCIVRPAPGVDPEYLALALQARPTKLQVSAAENGSSREGLNFAQVGSLVLALPPGGVAGQRAIVARIRDELVGMELLEADAQHQAGSLNEYRTALTKAAVLGHLDEGALTDLGKAACR
jgi:type I restriction enzyme S subunit